METIAEAEKNTTEVTCDEVITSSILPGVAIRPPSEEARRRALEGIAALRTLQESILARRGGKPFTEEELTAALHEARAAHDRGE